MQLYTSSRALCPFSSSIRPWWHLVGSIALALRADTCVFPPPDDNQLMQRLLFPRRAFFAMTAFPIFLIFVQMAETEYERLIALAQTATAASADMAGAR